MGDCLHLGQRQLCRCRSHLCLPPSPGEGVELRCSKRQLRELCATRIARNSGCRPRLLHEQCVTGSMAGGGCSTTSVAVRKFQFGQSTFPFATLTIFDLHAQPHRARKSNRVPSWNVLQRQRLLSPLWCASLNIGSVYTAVCKATNTAVN